MVPPYIRESYNTIFDIKEEPENMEFILSKINHDDTETGIASGGEIVVFYGGPKCRKSTILNCVVSSIFNTDKDKTLNFRLDVKSNEQIVWFDTELPKTAYWRRQKRLNKMCGFKGKNNIDGFTAISLKRFSYHEKLEVIDHHLERLQKDGKIGVIVIDQIADLVHQINDSDSVSTMIRYLEKWTAETQALLLLTIHTTRGTPFMTGVAGHELSKKMDSGFYLEKNYSSRNTVVKHLLAREDECSDFEFGNNEFGYPEYVENGRNF